MSDNPRIPGHPSDMPSSRGPGNTGGNGSSQQPYNPPPVPPQSQGPTNHTRNILIGALVTVVSSTIIYYLTVYQNRNKTDENNSYRIKENTIEAWQSYMAYENIYTKNVLVLDSAIVDPFQLYAEVKKESDKFTRDMQELIKRKYLDKDLVKALERRLENEKNYIPQFEKFIFRIGGLQKSNIPMQEKIDKQAAEMSGWVTQYRAIYERAANDITEIAKILSDRYRHAFTMSDFELVKRTPGKLRELDSIIHILQNTRVDSSGNIILGISFARNVKAASLVGEWTTRTIDVSIEEKGEIRWTAPNGGEMVGNWKLENDKLKVKGVIKPADDKVDWTFKLAYIQPNSFTLANDAPPFEIYKMVRKKQD